VRRAPVMYLQSDALLTVDADGHPGWHGRYISLFPLMLQMLPPDSTELGVQLQQLTDPQLLWTPYGLR